MLLLSNDSRLYTRKPSTGLVKLNTGDDIAKRTTALAARPLEPNGNW